MIIELCFDVEQSSLTERRVIIIRMIVTTTAIVMTRAINRNREDYTH